MKVKELFTRILQALYLCGVEEEYTEGIWTVRKWKSGIAECWGYTATTSITCDSPWGNGYYSPLQTVNFPSGLFYSTPKTVHPQIWDNGGGFYATLKAWNKNNVQYYIFSPKSETRSCDTNFYIMGKWK